MTQHEERSAGQSTAVGAPASTPAPADSSRWAPLRQRAFRWLWLGVLISWIGTWMLNAGAQWLVVHASNAAALVSLVQAASTLPVMLLALPGGVLADSFDRRWLLLTVQAYFFIVGILLAVLTAAGQMPQPCCWPSPSPWPPAWRCGSPPGGLPSPSSCPGRNCGRRPDWISSASTCQWRSDRRWPGWSSPTWAGCRWSSL